MDWKTLAIAYGTVFMAELGDKTQLATLTLASGERRGKLLVFLGSALALVTTSAIAVLAGEGVSRAISPVWLRRIAGVAFLILGVWFVWKPGE